MEAGTASGYPVEFSVDYPDRQLNRLTTAFRLIVAIPILIVAATLGHEGGSYNYGGDQWAWGGGGAAAVLCASIFHYGQYTVGEAKARMSAAGIPVRE